MAVSTKEPPTSTATPTPPAAALFGLPQPVADATADTENAVETAA